MDGELVGAGLPELETVWGVLLAWLVDEFDVGCVGVRVEEVDEEVAVLDADHLGGDG